jgi:hypothetical protein
MLAPIAGVGDTSALTATLTAAGLDADGEPEGVGDGVGLTLPDADPLGVGSMVGPGGDDTEPAVGPAVTRITRGVGAPCTGAAPALGDDEAEPPVDGDGDGAGTDGLTVTTGAGWPPASGIATPCATAASSAARDPAPIAYQVAMNGGGHKRLNDARGSRTTRPPAPPVP